MRTVPIAAALLAAAGGLLYLAGFPNRAAEALAEAAQKLRDARTLSYRMSMQVPGAEEPVTLRFFYKDPGRVRAELEREGGPVTVADLERGESLVLDPSAKTALLVNLLLDREQSDEGDGLPDPGARMVERLRTLAEKGEPAGERQIGEVRARGFRVKQKGREMTVWVDPKTKQPLRVESTVRVQGRDARVTLTDIRIDPELDDALFRLEPPEGYKLRRVEAEMPSPAEDVARLLRAYSDLSGGTFPRRLDDWAAYDAQFRKKKLGPADPEFVGLIQTVIRVTLFTRGEEYGYRAEGVKRGDADKILFWHRPKGAEKYRVVYGDLRVGAATADQLPEKPKE